MRPIGCRQVASRRIRPVAGRALGRSGRREGGPVSGERDSGSGTAAGPVDTGLRVDDHARRCGGCAPGVRKIGHYGTLVLGIPALNLMVFFVEAKSDVFG